MNCQACGAHPATVQYTEVVGGEKKVEWLCHACAEDRGLVVFKAPSVEITVATSQAMVPAAEDDEQCRECGSSLTLVRRTGRVGCAGCYETFWPHLEPLIKRVHGTTEHRWEPEPVDDQSRLRRILVQLRRDLADAIGLEDFERAAALRDEISHHEVELDALEKS